MANDCPPENYVAVKRRVPVRDSPMRQLRNIFLAATYILHDFVHFTYSALGPALIRRFAGYV